MKQNDIITTINPDVNQQSDIKMIETNKGEELENSELKSDPKQIKTNLLDSLYENFIFFLKNFNKSKKKDRPSASQKRIFARKNKIKKKQSKKKIQQSSYPKDQKPKNVEIKEKSLNEVYEIFKDQLKPEDFAKIVEFMKNNNYENISESLQRFPQHLKTLINLKKKENINHINTRKSESFLTYLKEKGKRGYNDIPSNCTHVKVCYFIWKCQGNGDKDPTAIGRKIKKMALFVS